jgi:hypothetical protein
MMGELFPPWIFPLLFVGFWSAVCLLLSKIGGWSTLTQRYGSTAAFQGELKRFQSATLRYSVGYNGCLTIGVNEGGLYLSILFLFRPGHPSLFIPWADVSTPAERRVWFVSCLEFRFHGAPRIHFRVNRKLGEWIASAARNAWASQGQWQVNGSQSYSCGQPFRDAGAGTRARSEEG